ncbi:hypothetical protein M569_04713 [Genlisea aurea]|uniref:FAD-binding PCMH-type domain-containing protein n=1 Tax=Genlisea aurea TaxID=192259 RepID=S8EBV3_9LAMI|nr:hypothetical protein M569_04713 [Genlisea aurea]
MVNLSRTISEVIYTESAPSYSALLEKRIWNLRFNGSTTPRPRLIVAASRVSHVRAAILCARAHGIRMKIRSGGHDFEGISYRSRDPNFFVLDMFGFRSIAVDIGDESARVGVGATLGELYYAIAEKSGVHGFPAGVCSTVGVGGHFTGGGYGNMLRKYGLTIDNIVDAEMVDVDGNLLNRESMGEDLFWAITGGGGYSFGVILSYKIKLVSVPEEVTVFRVHRRRDENFTDLVFRYQEIAAGVLPEELFIRLSLGVENGENRAEFIALFLGNPTELTTILNRFFPQLAFSQTDCVQMSWLESVLFWMYFPVGTPTAALLDLASSHPNHSKIKSDYLKTPIPKEGLDSLFAKMAETKIAGLVFNPYGGRMAEIPPTEKPFPHRAGNVAKLQYAAYWSGEKDAADRNAEAVRELYDFMAPYVSTDPREAFLNYRDLDVGTNRNDSYEEGLVYGRKYFGENLERLVKVKTEVDPTDFFRNEQSIPVFVNRRRNTRRKHIS